MDTPEVLVLDDTLLELRHVSWSHVIQHGVDYHLVQSHILPLLHHVEEFV